MNNKGQGEVGMFLSMFGLMAFLLIGGCCMGEAGKASIKVIDNKDYVCYNLRLHDFKLDKYTCFEVGKEVAIKEQALEVSK